MLPHGALRLSVIVPAWNAEATLATAVESILGDTSLPAEVIVVDDGSSDGTLAVAHRLADADSRVVVISGPNGGVSAARNLGLEAARGEWLAFVDADDRVLPGGFAALLRAADEHDVLAVVGQRVSTDGTRTWYPALYEHAGIRRAGRRSLLRDRDLLYYAGPVGKLYHRSCAEGLRFTGRMLGDQPWVLRALLRAGDRIQVIEDVVYEWRRPGSEADPQTITSARERSVPLSIEAVAMARLAFREVTTAWAGLAAPDERLALGVAYLDRLIRVDLAKGLRQALERGDPDTGRLLAAFEELVADVPPGVTAGSYAVIDHLVRQPLTAWSRLSPEGRNAYWSLARRVESAGRRADPAMRRGVLGSPTMRVALRTDHALVRSLAVVALRAHAVASVRRSRGRVPHAVMASPAGEEPTVTAMLGQGPR